MGPHTEQFIQRETPLCCKTLQLQPTQNKETAPEAEGSK